MVRGLAPEIGKLSVAFLDHLYVKGYSLSTVRSHMKSLELIDLYLRQTGDRRSVQELSVEDLRLFCIHMLDRCAVSSVYGYVVGIRQFFAFLVESGILDESPASNISPPTLHERRTRILEESELKALLRACSGGQFIDRRDMALFRVLMATGAYVREVLELGVDSQDPGAGSLDLKDGTLTIASRDGHRRRCALDPRTVNCLKQYLRLRSRHRLGHLPDLWLSNRGRLSREGVHGLVRRRRKKAGLKNFNLRRIRATFAHRWISGGGNEGDLMRTLGLSNRRMIERYAERVSATISVDHARDLFAKRVSL